MLYAAEVVFPVIHVSLPGNTTLREGLIIFGIGTENGYTAMQEKEMNAECLDSNFANLFAKYDAKMFVVLPLLARIVIIHI